MNRLKHFVLVAAVIVLVGAGCNEKTSAPTKAVPETKAPAEEVEIDAAEEEEEKEDVSAETMELTTPADLIDETWQTYTSRDESFSFQWPTRGRYAPQWTVDFVAEDDERLTDGCITADSEPETLMVGETNFCHTGMLNDSSNMATDYFVTQDDQGNTLITFTKDSSVTPEDFSWDEYQQHLKDIVSTYQLAK